MKFVFDKSFIMKNAHRLYRSGRHGDWSACVTKAWQSAKNIKVALEPIGEEARTYGGWLALGFEVIHGEHTVAQCIVNSVRWASKTTEVLSFFTRSQVCPIGTQAPKS